MNIATDSHSSQEQAKMVALQRYRVWLLTFVSLFTSLLAFFVLIITLTEVEGVAPKRSYQKVLGGLYGNLAQIHQQKGMDWLRIENTFAKGVRISFDPELFAQAPLFQSARPDIQPRYFPYLNEIIEALDEADLLNFQQQYARMLATLRANGMEVQLMIRIEGHTDARPLAPTARFRDNVQLSTFRAYEVMNYLQQALEWPESMFAIAGYGSFHPITDNPNDPENRRIEIYVVPVLNLLPEVRR
jgi:chemotaxis protein MotB